MKWLLKPELALLDVSRIAVQYDKNALVVKNISVESGKVGSVELSCSFEQYSCTSSSISLDLEPGTLPQFVF